VHEIPVAKALVTLAEKRKPKKMGVPPLPFDPFSFEKRESETISAAGIATGGDQLVRVVVRRATYDKLSHKLSALGDFQPEIVCEDAGILELDPRDDEAVATANASPVPRFVTIADECELDVIPAFRMLAARILPKHPILLKDSFGKRERNQDFLENLLIASTNIGSLLCDGIGDAVLVQGEEAPGQSLRIAYNILQAAGVRIFKTDYVACPSCGRTLFNLQETTARIKEATIHLKGVRIAIMGCIVNGPGEMADADFGYVGGAPGKVNLYVGKTPVKFNIPEKEAVAQLVSLIREHGRWFDPPAA
jgi:(E)-4-hydroxy-3-methylbut-2-enyl-diphosphate synthase